MFVKIPEDGYWFKKDGYWCTKRPNGGWNESPVDVFYQPNPDTSLGHTNYFGMFIKTDPYTGKSTGSVYITEASSVFSDPIAGIPTDDGEVIVSRYRHDYVEKDGRMIDGGRDYTRSSAHQSVIITVDGDQFVVSEGEDIEERI